MYIVPITSTRVESRTAISCMQFTAHQAFLSGPKNNSKLISNLFQLYSTIIRWIIQILYIFNIIKL